MPQHTNISNKKPFDVFLCHNNKDKPEVKKIAEQLKQAGIAPWLDEWELSPGQPWQRLLEQQIGEIKSAAVFVGKDGVGPWQHIELEALLSEFVQRGCPVIPAVLADAPEKPQLPLFLSNMTWVDFHKQEPDPMKQLIWGITSQRPDADGSKVAHDAIASAQFSVSKVVSLSFLKKGELVDNLLACACISNRDSRETVLGLLNEQFRGIANTISRRTDNRSDMMEIVSTCLKHSGGLDALIDIVCYFEGQTSTYTQQLQAFIASNSL